VKKGIVRDAAVHAAVCEDIAALRFARLEDRRRYSVADRWRRGESRIPARGAA
jgi:hypothetical protein